MLLRIGHFCDKVMKIFFYLLQTKRTIEFKIRENNLIMNIN